MELQSLTSVFDRKSLNKYLSKNVVSQARRVYNEMHEDALNPLTEIRKIIVKAKKRESGAEKGRLDIIVIRKKRYLLLPGKKAKKTADNQSLIKLDDKAMRASIRKLYYSAKEKLGLNVLNK